MKTESISEWLKRGNKIKKLTTQAPEKQITADCLEKAQPSFFEDDATLDQVDSELNNEADNGNVHAFFQRQASKRSSVNHR